MRVEQTSPEFGGFFRLGNGIVIVDEATGKTLECSTVAKLEDAGRISKLAIRLELVRPDQQAPSAESATVEAGVWLSPEEAEELIENLRGCIEELRSGEFEQDTLRRLAERGA